MIRLSRRRLVQGAAAVAAGMAVPHTGFTQTSTQKTLRATTRTIDVAGKAATVFGLLDEQGRHGLVFDAGDRFAVRLENRSGEPTLVHWHGLTPPWRQDGTPAISAPLLPDGADADYDFTLARPGTNWMHAHTLQEQKLMAAPLVVRDPAERHLDEQEVVVLMHDFSFRSPEELLADLQKDGAPGHGMMGQGAAMKPGAMMGGGMMHGGMMHGGGSRSMPMGMGGMDVNDIEYDAYLANDRTLDDPEVISVERGGKVRLRLINGSTATAYTLDLGALDGELVAVDGMPVRPLVGRRFPFAMGQRLDIRLTLPNEARAWPILALREGARQRTGFVLAAGGATVDRIPVLAEEVGPLIDIDFDTSLAAAQPLVDRPADRRVEVLLTGGMHGYRWAMEGMPDPQPASRGERIEAVMRNMSMMAHPMHLHGHHFQVIGVDGRRFSGPVRDTVVVPPMREVTIAFDADNPGIWAFHCHHLYHMAAGMMAHIEYDRYA
ncbi:MAG: multicopper oxidase domain-containing protein [Rhizobiaceae bacterium]|nr:MAG: multicopper oxidase domain-containing protein [Rhizobiaceae bacterium]CAG0951242.1 multicopper oxidase [Rhizobiaceae bacterium]